MKLKNYIIDKFINKNETYEIYSGIDNKRNKNIFILISLKQNDNLFKDEVLMLKKLINFKGIPLIIDYEYDKKINYIIIEDIGYCLKDLYKLCNKKFNKYTIFIILNHILIIFKNLNENGYYYNNLCLENLFIKFDNNFNRINLFIIDFTKINKEKISLNKFSSIDNHNGFYKSNRGELESIFYLINYLKNKKLDWVNKKLKNNIILKSNFRDNFNKKDIWYSIINQKLNINDKIKIINNEIKKLQKFDIWSWDLIYHQNKEENWNKIEYYSILKNKSNDFIKEIKELELKNNLIRDYININLKKDNNKMENCIIY